MKKLLSVAAVAAIVTSAFAFSANRVAKFCVRNAAETACEVLAGTKQITSGTPNFKHYPLASGQWDGSTSGCTSAGIANCATDIRLVND